MTPGARVQAAIEILEDILGGVPAEKALTGWARRSRFAGSKDRAAVRDHVYDALRQRRRACELGGGLSGRQVMLGLLRAQGADPADFFTGVGHAPALLEESELMQHNASGQAELPDWLVPMFRESLGDDAEQVFEALGQRAPVYLRVNLARATRKEAQAILAEDGIKATPDDIAETALRVAAGDRRIANSRAFGDGIVELQDGSGQAAMALLPVTNGARVLDYCAGGGGKSLAMAARGARVFAHDVNAARMKDIPVRAKRAGVTIETLAPNSIEAQYDGVLCDAPCSGSGTWRRAPDAKWRLAPQDLQDLTALQGEILENASQFVAKGGWLAYATCSVLEVENSAVVVDFAARHSEFDAPDLHLWRPVGGSDGFFLAMMQRRRD